MKLTAYPTIWEETEFTVNVNRTLFDLGGYTPPDPPSEASIDFGALLGNPPCEFPEICHNNGAFSSIIYHEYGHHVVEMGGSGQGAYGEGMSDTLGVIILDDPCIGLGAESCSVCPRSANNECDYDPDNCSSECPPAPQDAHVCGQVLSGCVWDTREALVANEVSGYQDILMSLAVNSVCLHSGTDITPQITLDWLILDDDDSCIWEGTPNSAEICTGFEAHNMWDHGCHCPDCPGDLNNDGEIEAFDLALVLGAWGPCPSQGDCCKDLDCSGGVGAGDSAIVLANWGLCTGRSPSDGDGSPTLTEALALMDYDSVDEFVTWLLSGDTNEAFESVQYLHSLLTE